MSDFDELFSSLRSEAVEALARDSKIKIVTEYDEPSLKAGEYWYSVNENTLYVGSDVTEDTVLYITNFIIRKTSFKLIEPPRIKSKIAFNIPSVSIHSNCNIREPHRIYLNKIHTVPIIKTYTITNKANKIDISESHNIALPIISFESEVVKL